MTEDADDETKAGDDEVDVGADEDTADKLG